MSLQNGVPWGNLALIRKMILRAIKGLWALFQALRYPGKSIVGGLGDPGEQGSGSAGSAIALTIGFLT